MVALAENGSWDLESRRSARGDNHSIQTSQSFSPGHSTSTIQTYIEHANQNTESAGHRRTREWTKHSTQKWTIHTSYRSIYYIRDHAWCLTPILQGRRGFLEMWGSDFLVIRVCYASRSKSLRSWILKKSDGWVLSTVINYTHPARAEITGIWQGIDFFVVKYWHWVKSEANVPKHLEILRTPICLVSF